MNTSLDDIVKVLGGNKEFKITISNEDILKLSGGIFAAVLLAVFIANVLAKKTT